MISKNPLLQLGHQSTEFEFWPNFLSSDEADKLFEELLQKVPWRHENLFMYGRNMPMPRLTAWYGDVGASYTYSGVKNEPLPWLPSLFEVRKRLAFFIGSDFNSLLLNFYRNGKDSLSWHQDNEPELGPEPLIASISLGVTRRFDVKEAAGGEVKFKLSLNSGSLLVMRGRAQSEWLHSIPKSSEKEKRINLTFRNVETLPPQKLLF